MRSFAFLRDPSTKSSLRESETDRRPLVFLCIFLLFRGYTQSHSKPKLLKIAIERHKNPQKENLVHPWFFVRFCAFSWLYFETIRNRNLVNRMKPATTSYFLVLMTAFSSMCQAESPSDLADQIKPLIETHKGTVAVSIKHLPTGQTFQHLADQPMPTASLIKLPVLVAMHQAIDAGKVSLDTEIKLQEEDMVPGSGVLTGNFSPGTKIKLRDAARLMIVFSDNTATNLVVDQIGLDATAKLMDQMGYPNTKMHAKVFKRETSIFPERSKQFGLGSTTANEMVGLLEKIAAGEVVSESASQAIIDLLYACDDRTKIPRELPSEVKVAHKTGAVSNAQDRRGDYRGTHGPHRHLHPDERKCRSQAGPTTTRPTSSAARFRQGSVRLLQPGGNWSTARTAAVGSRFRWRVGRGATANVKCSLAAVTRFGRGWRFWPSDRASCQSLSTLGRVAGNRDR